MKNLIKPSLLFGITVMLMISGCTPKKELPPLDGSQLLHQLNASLTDAIIHDGFSPPVASRVYAYPNIAAYEAVRFEDDNFTSYAGKLNGLNEPLPEPENLDKYAPLVAMTVAFIDVGKALIYRDYLLDSAQTAMLDTLKPYYSEAIYNSSMEYGHTLAGKLLDWINKDMYKETRNMPRFSPTGELGKWEPTPPTFGESVEPHWMKIRPLVLDSLYIMDDPIPFDSTEGSAFYNATYDVYNAVAAAEKDEHEYALFWDCNPQKTNVKGHFMFVTRQLTPGGHWMAIATIAIKMKDYDLVNSAYVYSLMSVSIMDVFINCWQEKYRTDLIRPETYINRYIEPNWEPFLETPLFPEHPSGHSSISGAAATILTHIFGDNFAYTDSSEEPFGLKPRSYKSFNEAANEAMMSRFHGGIHYMPACTVGLEMGQKVAKVALAKADVKQSTK